jgi:predicted acylesterase/phospholipase RssA
MEFDLVFEGGGAKGMSFVGALQAFAAGGHSPGRLLGTSAGAITATALAAGYTPDEIATALLETVDGKPDGKSVFTTFLGDPDELTEAERQEGALRKLLDGVDLPLVPEALERRVDDLLLERMASSPKLRNFLSFVERGGWYSADAFVVWLTRMLNTGSDRGAARNYGGMTLKELFEATGRELSLVAADTTDSRMLVLNHRTAPDLPVVYAARMSMSVPLLWQEVIWRPEWGKYRGRDLSGHAVVDGGLLSNFPIELYVSGDPEVTAVMGEKSARSVIGFLIDETLEVKGAPPPAKPSAPSLLSEAKTFQRLKQLANTATQAHDKAAIDSFEHLVVRLPAKTYGTTEFDMTPARRQALIAAGLGITRSYLDDRLAPMPGGVMGDLQMDVTPENDDLARRRALRMLED